MNKEMRSIVISALVGALVTILLGYLFGVFEKKVDIFIEDNQVKLAAQQILQDEKFKTEILNNIASRPYDFDTGWIKISEGETESFDVNLGEIPAAISAFYMTSDGKIFPWGMNHYGNRYQVNGILIDYDNSASGKLYIRTPRPYQPIKKETYSGFVFHPGHYSNRENDGGYEDLFTKKNVKFRVVAWRQLSPTP